MTEITLINTSSDGKLLKAVYNPDKGMNLLSFKKDFIEVIDQSTKPLFEERCAGLGALIGPHFHRRHFEMLPEILRNHSNPEIELLRNQNPKIDPFSHGIGRYASWKYEKSESSISAVLQGSDTWNGIPLKEIEGQDFNMKYSANLTPNGLQIELSVVSETDSLIGIHHYYHLPKKKGIVTGNVRSHYLADLQKHEIPNSWNYSRQTTTLKYSLDGEADFTFWSAPDPTRGTILLDTELYQLKTSYVSKNEECSWQLWHPEGASFVCIEPISSQDPRHPNLTVSSIKIDLEIIDVDIISINV